MIISLEDFLLSHRLCDNKMWIINRGLVRHINFCIYIRKRKHIILYYPFTNCSLVILHIDILLGLLSELNFPGKYQYYVIAGIYHSKIVLQIILLDIISILFETLLKCLILLFTKYLWLLILIQFI